MATRAWQILAPARDQARVLKAVQEITGVLRTEHPAASLDPTLGHGAAGLALYFDAVARTLDVEAYFDDARIYLNESLQRAWSVAPTPGLIDGLAGIAAVDARISMREVDETLHAMLRTLLHSRLESLLHECGSGLERGLMGCASYLLERRDCLPSRRILQELLPALASRVEQPLDLSGHCVLLARSGDGAAADLLRDQLARAAQLLERHPALSLDLFDELVFANRLLHATAAIQESSLVDTVLARLRRLPQRERAAARFRGHELWHGAAGIAHLYNRLYQLSRVVELGEQARWWLERCLQLRRAGHGIAGFLGQRGSATRAVPGLWAGAAGTGLALLASVSEIEPAWDRLLLFSV